MCALVNNDVVTVGLETNADTTADERQLHRCCVGAWVRLMVCRLEEARRIRFFRFSNVLLPQSPKSERRTASRLCLQEELSLSHGEHGQHVLKEN